MAAANFPHPILDFTLVEEGGFSDDANDPGGATEHGVTLAVFRKVMKNPALTVADLKAITPAEEMRVYQPGYWMTVRGDDLPSGVDLMTFDFGVNSGPGESEMLLQEAAGLTGDDVDGALGPMSMAAISRASPSDLIAKLAGVQKAHYRSLKTFRFFGVGWLSRTDRRAAAALKLVDAGGPVA